VNFAESLSPLPYSGARKNKKTYNVFEDKHGFIVSVVTYIELVQGMRNKSELTELRRAFRVWNITTLCINEEISSKTIFYIERYYLSHSLQLADA
jgi:hypothetical protein